MAHRGLQLRKRSDSLNDANIRRCSTIQNDKVGEMTEELEKLSLRPERKKGTTNRGRSNTLQSTEIENLSIQQKNEHPSGSSIFDRFLSTLGFHRTVTIEGARKTATEIENGVILEPVENSLPSDAEVEKDSDDVIDYQRIGLFREIDLESDHADFLIDIVKYAFSMQANYPSTTESDWRSLGGYRTFTLTNLFLIEVFYSERFATEVLPLAAYFVSVTVSKRKIRRDQLEDLSVAAIRLASKVESQYSMSTDALIDFDMRKLNRMEREICRATDFHFLRCSALFFMRIIQKLVERYSWQWKFAKFASQLACCQVELATLKPTLLAGVIMRLCCLLISDEDWPHECYSVLGEPISNYDEPHAILCRLILTARIADEFAEAYARYQTIIEHALSLRPGWIEKQSTAANTVKMAGNLVFGEK
ncbi:hypothetical protein RB195_012867 [Necator americanus]|uniref:Cyclin N-terminal domain-containing protein n=1 Tax=Necator americanus TaxID=51031 RepID=A0ABR1DSX5_NECAM